MKKTLYTFILLFSTSLQADNNPLNHLFFRLDIQTVQEISNNDFLLNEFSDFYAGEIGDLKNKWTAVYIQGKKTYLEIYDSNGSSTKANVGIAFASNKLGNLDNMLSVFKANCKQPYICEIEERRKSETGPIWFKQFKWLDNDDTLDTWVMEYGREYINSKETSEGSVWSNNDISSTRYNSQWFKEERIMKDIELIHLFVTKESMKRITKVAHLLGYEISKVHNKDIIILIKNGINRFRLTESKINKVEKIYFSLNRWVKRKTLVIGKSELSLIANQAIWLFE